jgi:hypothetical protein
LTPLAPPVTLDDHAAPAAIVFEPQGKVFVVLTIRLAALGAEKDEIRLGFISRSGQAVKSAAIPVKAESVDYASATLLYNSRNKELLLSYRNGNSILQRLDRNGHIRGRPFQHSLGYGFNVSWDFHTNHYLVAWEEFYLAPPVQIRAQVLNDQLRPVGRILTLYEQAYTFTFPFGPFTVYDPSSRAFLVFWNPTSEKMKWRISYRGVSGDAKFTTPVVETDVMRSLNLILPNPDGGFLLITRGTVAVRLTSDFQPLSDFGLSCPGPAPVGWQFLAFNGYAREFLAAWSYALPGESYDLFAQRIRLKPGIGVCE